MDGKIVGGLVVVALLFGGFLGYKAASGRYGAEIYRIQKESEIYRSQADNYAKTIKVIKEAAESATPVATPESKI